MGNPTRRVFLVSGAASLVRTAAPQSSPLPDAIHKLRPMTGGIHPIQREEYEARVEKARRYMRENRLNAVLMERGSSAYYFSGERRDQILLMSRRDEPVWLPLGTGDTKYKPVAEALKERGAVTGRLGIEERVRFEVVDALGKLAPALEFTSADPVTAGCRMIKSPAELALMQRANDITIACYRAALASLREGMTQHELSANIAAAYKALGVDGNAMAIFGKYTAYPHGSVQPQKLREGDLVLIDDGCSVEGYQSDVTRTVIFGKATARQREIWELERRAQDAALAAAKPGRPCEDVDAAARKVITDYGFGPGYKVPGLPHRTGHGIGLDGHEWPYLVHGNKRPLEPGMCFSDEPTIAIYGEFGVRLEDCMYITEDGARLFTKQSPAIDQPFG
ncbi:MAG TPA: Xaa-Pro peptidase family protein [Bryobacteraceae bacterium]|nr:Xaa-Pro peptidase family protein [Bryobacteraceae bacterium]